MATVMLPEGPPAWTRSSSTSSAIAPWIELTLSRNLADHLFPNCATEEELRVIEARVLDALEKVGLGSRGYYLPMHELSTIDQYQLVERRLASEELLHRTGPRGVFLREDQVLSVMVNGVDHLTIRCTLSGHAGEASAASGPPSGAAGGCCSVLFGGGWCGWRAWAGQSGGWCYGGPRC